jgi:hypothetical protein
MRLYVSGAMTGKRLNNFPAFNRAAANLQAAGFDVENPAEKGNIDGWEWEDYLRYDIAKLLECDGVATLPGWRASRGATLEVHIARALSMTVHPVETWVLTAEAVRARVAV